MVGVSVSRKLFLKLKITFWQVSFIVKQGKNWFKGDFFRGEMQFVFFILGFFKEQKQIQKQVFIFKVSAPSNVSWCFLISKQLLN